MSELMNIFIQYIFSFISTFVILKKLIPFFRKKIPAIPNERGMHKLAKATSGGVSFILIYLIFAIYQGFYLPLFSLTMAIIGIIDDKYNISRIIRIIAQVTTLIIIIFSGFPRSLARNITGLRVIAMAAAPAKTKNQNFPMRSGMIEKFYDFSISLEEFFVKLYIQSHIF